MPPFAFPWLHYLPLLTCTLYMCTLYICAHACIHVCIHVQTRDNLLNQGHVNYSEMSISPPLHIFHHCLPLSLSAGLRNAFFETSFQQMFVDGHRSGCDDLLFYVMYDHNEDRDTVEFMRTDSKTLPRYTGTCTVYAHVHTMYAMYILVHHGYCLGCVPDSLYIHVHVVPLRN